jgi:hypothetical protein
MDIRRRPLDAEPSFIEAEINVPVEGSPYRKAADLRPRRVGSGCGGSMGASWIDVLAAISGSLPALTALIAVAIAVRNERRSREVLKAQMYLTLRPGFLDSIGSWLT